MKYKAIIENQFGKAEFEFVAKNKEELEKAKKRFSPKAKVPYRETVYIVGIDCGYFEQLW